MSLLTSKIYVALYFSCKLRWWAVTQICSLRGYELLYCHRSKDLSNCLHWKCKIVNNVQLFSYHTFNDSNFSISAMGLGHVDENAHDKKRQRMYNTRYIKNVSFWVKRAEYKSLLSRVIFPEAFLNGKAKCQVKRYRQVSANIFLCQSLQQKINQSMCKQTNEYRT